MTQPTNAFTELSASPVQKIDVTDGVAMARAILQSEARANVYNGLNMMVLNGAQPPVVVTHLDNSAPPLNVPSTGAPADIVGSMMEQMQARLAGSGERRIMWGTGSNGHNELGDMKITRGNVGTTAFADQMTAIEQLRANLQTRVVQPMLSAGYVDMLSGLPSAGNELVTKAFFAQKFVEVVRDYQRDIQAATMGGSPGSKASVEYTGPSTVAPRQEQLLTQYTENTAKMFDQLADNLPAYQLGTKPATRAAPLRHE